MILVRLTVAETTAVAVLTNLTGTYMSVCLWTDFCHHSNVTTMQGTVTKHYRCVTEITMKAEFKDRCGSEYSCSNEYLVLMGHNFNMLTGIVAGFIYSQDSKV